MLTLVGMSQSLSHSFRFLTVMLGIAFTVLISQNVGANQKRRKPLPKTHYQSKKALPGVLPEKVAIVEKRRPTGQFMDVVLPK